MKINLLLALLCCVSLWNCTATSTDDNQTAAAYDATPAIIDFDFELLGEINNSNKTVSQINVINKENTQLHQKLKGFEAEVHENEEVLVEDLNFDGYPDIRLMKYLPGTMEIPFYYWLYNPTNRQFERATFLESVLSPSVDTENELLKSSWRKSEKEYGVNYFAYTNDSIQLVKQEVYEYMADDVVHRITKTLVNGTFEKTKEEVVVEEN